MRRSSPMWLVHALATTRIDYTFAPTSGSDLRAEINVEDASWFNVIVLLLVGHIIDVNHHATCLISDRGWSIYMNTFRTPDPAFIDPDSSESSWEYLSGTGCANTPF